MARGKSGDSPGIATRVVQAARYVISEVKPNSWLSPGQPLRPNAPDGTQAFRWDMPVGFNMQVSPRPKGRVTYAECWHLVNNCDLLRIIIERRKDQLQSLPWQITPRIDSKAKPNDPRIKTVESFLRYPDKENDWGGWLRALLDDLFVIDAVAIEKRRDMKGRLFSLDLIPGDSIALLADPTGRKPLPPSPAYHQVHKGSIVANYTTDEMIYAPRNVSTRDIYGYSPVKWIYNTVNIAIERAATQLSHYTDGNLNKGIFWLDPTMTADQIAAVRDWWNSMTMGNVEARQQAAFLPGKAGSFQPIVDASLKDQFDEWLARIICFAFSIAPTPFIQQVNRATAESAAQAALEEGLAPLQSYIKSLIDRVIFQDFGFDDLEFSWKNDAEQDPMVAAQIRASDVNAGIIDRDEARADMGRDPRGGSAAQLGVTTGAGFVALPSPEAVQAQDDAKVAGSQAATDLANNPPDPEDDPDNEGGKAVKALEKKYRNPLTTPAAKAAIPVILDRVNTAFRHSAQHVAAQLRGMAIMRKSDETDEERKARAKRIADQINLTDMTDIKAMSAPLADVATNAGMDAFADIGATVETGLFNQINTKAVTWAQSHAADMVTKVTDSTRDMLRQTIEQGLKETDINGIADRLVDAYAFSPERAKLIAETEVTNANGQGALTGFRAAAGTGLKITKEWLDHEGACIICQENADEGPIPLEEPFPSGDMTTGAHPRCECSIIANATE